MIRVRPPIIRRRVFCWLENIVRIDWPIVMIWADFLFAWFVSSFCARSSSSWFEDSSSISIRSSPKSCFLWKFSFSLSRIDFEVLSMFRSNFFRSAKIFSKAFRSTSCYWLSSTLFLNFSIIRRSSVFLV